MELAHSLYMFIFVDLHKLTDMNDNCVYSHVQNCSFNNFIYFRMSLWCIALQKGKNLELEQFVALSDSLDAMKLLLPDVAEYKDDMPLPKFLSQGQKSLIETAQEQQKELVSSLPTAEKRGVRADSSSLRAEDWQKLDSMVVYQIGTHIETSNRHFNICECL